MMHSWSRFTALPALLMLLLFAGGVAASAGPAVPLQLDDAPGTPAVTEQQLDEDFVANTTMVVELDPEGDADWTISTAFDLTSDEQREAFRTLAAEFEAGEGPALGRSAFERASTLADEETEREMAITDVNRTTAIDTENGTGELVVSFTWENFSRADDDRLHIDDVLVTERGLWLREIGPNQTLVIRPPENYDFFDTTIPPQNGELRWEGPVTFDAESLQATFTGTAPGGDDDTQPPPDPQPSMLPWLIAGAVALASLVVIVYLVFRVRSGAGLPGPLAGVDIGTTDEAEEDRPPVEDDPETTDESTDDRAAIDPELLSDEERVVRLVDRNGGRMKQANIVKETDWSNAKVSQLLSSMEDDGQIKKIRIGRENLVLFPEEDVTDLADRN